MNNQLSIAYLTTTYPAVSHTFIRRELLEMERRGHRVMRAALRPSNAPIVDPLDLDEAKKTFYCLSHSIFIHFISLLRLAVTRPLKLIKSVVLTLRTSRLSDRGIVRHFAYIIEASTLFWKLKKNRVEHVHVHFGTNAAAVARLVRCLGGPNYSFTVHGPAEFDAPIGLDLSGKIHDSLFVVAISDFCSAQLRRWAAPGEWEKIHIVRCTVGDRFFNTSVSINPDSKIFTCVGRLSPQKGQLVLVDAFAEVIASGIDATLVFVGDGELRPIIEERIEQKGIESSVRITGYVSEAEVRRHIISSRALVIPSFAEGLPMVIMEAFALGRPVISTYIAGIPELVRPGENGWLVPAANIPELVSVFEEALESKAEVLEEMARAGRQLTYKRHRTLTEGDRLERLFSRSVPVSA